MKDTIYREDVIKIIHHYFVDLIDSLPTITDFDGEENIEDLQKCNKYLEMNKTICGLIRELPSANPETGKWTEGRDKRFVKCSKCGMETTKNSLKGIALFGKNEPNFCPCYGSKMEGNNETT